MDGVGESMSCTDLFERAAPLRQNAAAGNQLVGVQRKLGVGSARSGDARQDVTEVVGVGRCALGIEAKACDGRLCVRGHPVLPQFPSTLDPASLDRSGRDTANDADR